MLIEPGQIADQTAAVIFDCRFALTDPEAGSNDYLAGHITGAYYLDLNRDLSAPAAKHGGRHPLPEPQVFAATLARFGVDKQTQVIAYDDSRFAFASRLWWMMRSLGYTPPLLVNGGYTGWLNSGGCQFFRYHDGEFFNGLVAVSFELYDTFENDGGFAISIAIGLAKQES